MLLRQSTIKWEQFRPLGKWLVVKESEAQTKTSGGIILPEQGVQAADVGFFSGIVLKEGTEIYNLVGMSLINKEVVFRKFKSDVIHFKERHEDGSKVFIIEINDLEAITMGAKINAI